MSPRFAILLVFGMLSLFPAPTAFAAGSAGADSRCSQVRMDGPGGSMEKVRARDQMQLGICFAETKAQLLDAIRFSRLGDKDHGFQTSAVALASGVSSEKGTNAFVEGSTSCSAMEYARKNGVCSQSVVEGSRTIGNELAGFTEGLRSSQALGRDIPWYPRKSSGGSSSGCVSPPPVMPLRDPAGMNPQVLSEVLGKAFEPQKSHAKITAACTIQPPRKTAMNPFAQLPLQCETFIAASDVSGKQSTAAEYRGKLHDLLDQPNPLPVEIHLCGKLLEKAPSVISRTSSGALNTSKDACGPHAALVIGRREVNGKCQFLVRNSWGTDCDHYTTSLQAGCEEGKGNIWLDADFLTGMTLGLVPPPSM